MKRLLEIIGAALVAGFASWFMIWRLLELAAAANANGGGDGSAIKFLLSTISILIIILSVNFAAWAAVGICLLGSEKNDTRLD